MGGRKTRGKWTPEIRERFLEVIRATGNAREAYRRIGHENMFRRRRRRHPDFAREWTAAEAEADARHREATGAFPGAAHPRHRPPAVKADPARLLKPAPKRKPKSRDYAIRRTRGGRTQIALVGERNMTAELEAEFFALLRETGNFSASALTLGFQPASLFERARRWPAFANSCDEALAEASVKLDYALIAHAHTLLRDPAEFRDEADGTTDVPFDPDKAMRILAFIESRRGGRTGKGGRKGPPGRSFDEAVASVLAKIAAIKKHKGANDP